MPFFTLPKNFHPDFARPGKKPVGPVEVDWGTPEKPNTITDGLIAAYVMTELGVLRDISGFGQNGSLTGTPTFDSSAKGRSIKFTASPQYTVLRNDRLDTPNGVSVVTGTISDSPGQNREVFEKQQGGTRFLQIVDAGTTDWRWFVRGSSAITYTLIGSTVVSGEYINLCGTAGSNGSRFYEHGIEVDSNGADPGDLDNTADIKIGGGTAGLYTGRIFYQWIYDRQLSPAEIASLNKDPYQILKPVNPIGFFTSTDVVVSRTSTVIGGGTADNTVAKNSTKTSTVSGGGTSDNTVTKSSTKTSTVIGGGFVTQITRKIVARISSVIGGGFADNTTSLGVVRTSSVIGGGFVTQITRKIVARISKVIGGGFADNIIPRGIVRTSTVIGGGTTDNTVTKSSIKTSTVIGGGTADNTVTKSSTKTSTVIGGGFINNIAGIGILRTSTVIGGGFTRSVGVTSDKILIKNQIIRGVSTLNQTIKGVSTLNQTIIAEIEV